MEASLDIYDGENYLCEIQRSVRNVPQTIICM